MAFENHLHPLNNVAAAGETSQLIAQKEFDALRAHAQAEGNKAANLGVLKKVVEKIPFLTVPVFHAVQHQTIYRYLQEKTNGQFQDKWNEFCHVFRTEQGLSLKTRSVLQEIEKLVRTTFCQSGTEIPDIKEFLNRVPPNCKTIIRSTGGEDTTFANAGGNKTCINIPPEEEKIAEAMGKVIGSYFSLRSIGQRIQAGDDVADEPFMPVLLQVMAGDSEEEGIPASGVIFADESTGKTPGISCIEGAWGHNELVVGGLGPVDRYFVGPESRIHKLIAVKKERLVSRREGKGLMPAANPSSIRSVSALNTCTLLSLHKFYQGLKPFYGGHVDGEFTQLDPSKNGCIFCKCVPFRKKEHCIPLT